MGLKIIPSNIESILAEAQKDSKLAISSGLEDYEYLHYRNMLLDLNLPPDEYEKAIKKLMDLMGY